MERADKQGPLTPRRIVLMLFGILLIGFCVAAFRLSGFGVDPYTCMNLGISSFIGMSFGNWQLIMNIAVLVLVFFTVRRYIGLGTLVNMVCVGYIADFICLPVQAAVGGELPFPIRIVMLCLGMLFASTGVASYMIADLGVAPYDAVAFIINKYSKGKISFRAGRVISDVTVVAAGVAFGLAAQENLWYLVGLGTILNAFFNGPLIQFFRTRFERMLKMEDRAG